MSEEVRKFYKTILQIEVLSEDEPIDDELSLKEIDYAITEGDCSGIVKIVETVELTPEQAAKALEAQGSDPEFFGLTEDGKPLNDA